MHSPDATHLIISNGKGKNKTYVCIYPMEENIYLDLASLPQTAFLCACYDGVSLLRVRISPRKNSERFFVPIKWVINEWGGPKNWIDAIKDVETRLMNDMHKFRKDLNDPNIRMAPN